MKSEMERERGKVWERERERERERGAGVLVDGKYISCIYEKINKVIYRSRHEIFSKDVNYMSAYRNCATYFIFARQKTTNIS